MATVQNEALPAGSVPAVPVGTVRNPGRGWLHSLGARALLGLLIVIAIVTLGVFAVIETQGKRLVLDESARLIEQMGNTAVSGLLVRTDEIAALTRTQAAIAERLPYEVEAFMQTLPNVIDFAGDTAVAGGGVWPEPYRFDAQLERRSFFWGRDAANNLQYFDDYNQPGPGYHNEEWYVPARFLAPGDCYWSQSYMDPYSYQPMVTCTVATEDGGGFSGTVTIDLRLEGLQAFADDWRRKTGGYVFIVDRNNRFITFPEPERVKRIATDADGNRTEDFILADELAQSEPRFTPLVAAMDALNRDTIAAARQTMGERFDHVSSAIDQGSYQVDAEQSQLIAAVTADPLRQRFSIESSTLYDTVDLPDDPLLGETATGYVFHVPETYWKLVVVKPLAEATAVADTLSRSLLVYLLVTILVVMAVAYLVFNRFLIMPLTGADSVMRKVGELINQRRYLELKDHHIQTRSRTEIGRLGDSINALIDRVVDNEGALARVNVTLEQKVEERTAELSRALAQLKASQAQLVQSEKMAMLGQMVAGVAHEINTPLGYVKNNVLITRDCMGQFDELLAAGRRLAQVLKREDASENQVHAALAEVSSLAGELSEQNLSEDLRQILEDTLFGVEQISELVVSLRNFARLDESKVKAVDVHECIESALKIGRNALKNRVDIRKRYGKLPAVSCSPAQINQVVLNILNNAAQAVEDDGIIAIATEADDRYVHISIQDNGKGIAEAHLGKVFEPFFTTKAAGEGTGLGLAICAQIVEQHQGRIRVASKVGKGTRFVISLPIRRSEDHTE